ncbi:hypothetical protein M404DRAFT_314942 [Pisolithus tinctorius Marx 270]|uniref:Uncharacterized protein n=1 Tax=Pisolithus tinctorius Marx 270 TaxID=870435 RepID=A0A0C3NJC1_PISTI|nr:hypothetical protein M404DRAFT_314942 [Pisolithus tinctorius Marx 270]
MLWVLQKCLRLKEIYYIRLRSNPDSVHPRREPTTHRNRPVIPQRMRTEHQFDGNRETLSQDSETPPNEVEHGINEIIQLRFYYHLVGKMDVHATKMIYQSLAPTPIHPNARTIRVVFREIESRDFNDVARITSYFFPDSTKCMERSQVLCRMVTIQIGNPLSKSPP